MALVAVLTGTAAGPALAEYIIRPGDTLEVAVAGIPDLKQRSVVDLDGLVTLPMIKPVPVGGLGLTAAQAAVKEEMSKKLYQQRTPAGAESVTAISPDAVTVSIAEYRPVYLNGDVSKPGEQAYRPGMTVRQAVSLAGGFEIMRFRMTNPFLESADLRNDYQTLWMQYVKLQGKVWRIKAQLAAPGGPQAPASPPAKGKAAADDPTADVKALEQLTQAPLPKELLDRTRDNARQQLELERTRYGAERAFLQRTVSVSDDQIALLRSRQVRDDENAQADTADYNKLKEFSERGNLPMTRLSEARRLFLFSATQSLQTGVQLTNTIRERDDAARKVVRLEEQTRADLLKDLDEANVELGGLQSKLQAVSEKITYTGMIRSQLVRGGGAKPSIRIVRSGLDGGGSETASEDSPVRPGDTVEVALHTEVPELSQ
ncbi:hypothetical protein ASG52_08465 [Methylobacterium sp. Leaf456]|nr:hypothetical protein ASG52_08465 [Methylobacterium sp. Leaf456]